MIAEQSVTCRYKVNGQNIEIQMTVWIETPADEPYGSVSFEPYFEPFFPEEQSEALYHRLQDGMHGGIALASVPVWPNNVAVRVLQLIVSPSLQDIQNTDDKIDVGYLLEATISGVVETLMRNLEHLRSGQAPYYQGQ